MMSGVELPVFIVQIKTAFRDNSHPSPFPVDYFEYFPQKILRFLIPFLGDSAAVLISHSVFMFLKAPQSHLDSLHEIERFANDRTDPLPRIQ